MAVTIQVAIFFVVIPCNVRYQYFRGSCCLHLHGITTQDHDLKLFVDFKKTHDTVRREVFYNFLIEFGIAIKQIGLIKT